MLAAIDGDLTEDAVRWLLWAERKPLERRGVLAITVAPVIAGLMANDAHAVASGRLSRVSVAPVRTLQVGLTALFGYSLARAGAAERAVERRA